MHPRLLNTTTRTPNSPPTSSPTSHPLPHHKTNFLHDVIYPATLNIENIRIINKHMSSLSPQTITKKVTEVKKTRIQKKIESIVKKNTELQAKNIDHKPKLKKYTKQNVKKQSKFQQEDQYKRQLFGKEMNVDSMKLNKYRDSLGTTSRMSKNKENSITGFRTNRETGKNDFDEDFDQCQHDNAMESPFIVELDEKAFQNRKMEQENFQPFKEKVKKVIDKTIKAGKNSHINALMDKVNFYLTSIAEPHGKERYKRITVDAQQRDRKVNSYCEQIEKGLLVKRSPKKMLTKNGMGVNDAKQTRSTSTGFLKTRPHTAALTSRPTLSANPHNFTSTPHRSLSSSQLNRYTTPSSNFNLHSKPSTIHPESLLFSTLLTHIETTCQQSKLTNPTITKEMARMSQEWNIDQNGFRVVGNKRMDMSEETLVMIRRLRRKQEEIERVEMEVMGEE